MAKKLKSKENWETTCNRYVAFFDVLGFKDMVMKKDHEYVLRKVQNAKLGSQIHFDGLINRFEKMETRLKSFQFSDSFFIFSESDTPQDALNIITQSGFFLKSCLSDQIPIKGAISVGKITADFQNHIFVGQPIIDAYLLHEELEMYGIILDSNAEKKISENIDFEYHERKISSEIIRYKVPTKSGKITYLCVNWVHVLGELFKVNGVNGKKSKGKMLLFPDSKHYVERFYQTVSGKARRYIDNTLDFIEHLTSRAKQAYPKAHEVEFTLGKQKE